MGLVFMGLGFMGLGFMGLGFRGLGLRIWGSGEEDGCKVVGFWGRWNTTDWWLQDLGEVDSRLRICTIGP